MFRPGVVALSGLLLSVSLAFADPVGAYDVEGSDPGGGATYRGTVEVVRTGETYQVTWTIRDATYTGTAIGNDNVLSVAYATVGSTQTGLAVYSREQGGDWAGLWTPADGTTLGKERWHRR
jgi:hypothetical protein